SRPGGIAWPSYRGRPTPPRKGRRPSRPRWAKARRSRVQLDHRSRIAGALGLHSRHLGAAPRSSCDPPAMAFGSAVDVPADASAAAWIPPRLGPFGTVGGLVPGGYERYLLVDYRRTEGPLGWDGVQLLSEQLARLLAAHTTTP